MKPEDQTAFDAWYGQFIENFLVASEWELREAWWHACAHRDAQPAVAVNEQLLEALKRIELAVDWQLGRSPFTQSNQGKGFTFSQQVRDECFAAHDEVRAAIAAAEKAKGGV